MDFYELQAELKRKGWTQAKLARELNVSATNVHLVMHGKGVSRKVQDLIAAILGLSVKEIWPGKEG